MNKVIQPWCDVEFEIKARGGCSESSLRISVVQNAIVRSLFVATAWTTGLGVWSDGRHAICPSRGTSVPSLPFFDDAGFF